MSALWCRRALVSLSTVVVALATPLAVAQAQRAFVASYGSDLALCSLANPCRSFNVAIPKVIAGGEVIVLDSAGYGPTTITQSVSLIAPAGVYAGVSVMSGAGVQINGAGIRVLLQNLALNGLGGNYGIIVQQADEVIVSNCSVSNFTLTGLATSSSTARLLVRDSVFRDNHQWGIEVGGPASAAIESVRVERNTFDGIRVDGNAVVSIKHSVIAGNGGSGVHLDSLSGRAASATIEDSLIADNAFDGITTTLVAGAGTFTDLSAARNTITRNTGYGISVSATLPGFGTASLTGNLISQNGLDGVWTTGTGARATANGNTFAGNGTGPLMAALHAVLGSTIDTVKGADGLPNNSGEQTTAILGNVVPANAF